MMMEGMNNMMGFGSGLGWIIWILLIGLIILSVRTVIDAQRKPLDREATFSDGDTSTEVLKQRLARGEISVEEYDHLRQKMMQ